MGFQGHFGQFGYLFVYIGHFFIGLEGILVIFWFWGYYGHFCTFWRYEEYFGHIWGFKDILVNLDIFCVYWLFLGFRGILVILIIF